MLLLAKAEKLLLELKEEREDIFEIFLAFYSLARAKVISRFIEDKADECGNIPELPKIEDEFSESEEED